MTSIGEIVDCVMVNIWNRKTDNGVKGFKDPDIFLEGLCDADFKSDPIRGVIRVVHIRLLGLVT